MSAIPGFRIELKPAQLRMLLNLIDLPYTFIESGKDWPIQLELNIDGSSGSTDVFLYADGTWMATSFLRRD